MKVTFSLLVLISIFCSANAQQPQNHGLLLIPEPQTLNLKDGKLIIDNDISVFVEQKEWKNLQEVIAYGFANICDRTVVFHPSERVNIIIQNTNELDSLEYSISVGGQILIKAGSYQAATFATSTLLQLVETENSKIIFQKVFIQDKPENQYQGLMIDVARKPHTIETLRQLVDVCFFYKFRFIQIHLNDDQSFTFPSDAYPDLATPGHSFTKKELNVLVSYANARGVTLIPEFDLPGHSGSLRRANPKLFGADDLYVVNLASPKVWEAIYTIAGEMMNIFNTSPYFHIGADEAWFEPLSKLPEVQKQIQKKGYDDVHDLFLEYIVNMNEFVKSRGNQTMVWESFQKNGSKHVTIPNDILVFAWETLYQQPQSLIDNGYTIINASWKPLYITPWMRWDQQAILDWNPAKWENHWKITPSFNGLQIDTTDAIIGVQMCAWEMTDKMEVSEVMYRLPALSAKSWSLWRNAPDNFNKRYEHLDSKLTKLLFPAEVNVSGILYPNYRGVQWNKENYFDKELTLEINANENQTIHYTLDGTVPITKNDILNDKLIFAESTHFKAKVYDPKGNEVGYLNRVFEYHPVKMEIEGKYSLPRDINIARKTFNLEDSVLMVSLSTPGNGTIRYSLDEEVSRSSMVYNSEIKINHTVQLQAALFIDDNKITGEKIKIKFFKTDQEDNITTNKKVMLSEQDLQYTASLAVDGIVDRDSFWSADSGAPQWMTIDLGENTEIGKIKFYTYWDGHRYYQYKIDVSKDNRNWENIVDFSDNTKIAKAKGFTHTFEPQQVRYIRATMLHNSANPGLHISEIRAYKK